MPSVDRTAHRRAAALRAGLATGVALALLPVAGASAASLTINTPCVEEDSPKVDIALGGFAADGLVNLTDNGNFLDAITVGGDGSFAGTFGAQHRTDFREQHTIVAADSAGNTATGSFFVTELAFLQKPMLAKKFDSKVSYVFEGFIGGGTLYAHYTFSKSETKKLPAKTIKLGTLQGPCGSLTTGKIAQLPIKKPKVGTYEIQFDTNPVYKRQEGIYLETYFYVAKTAKKKEVGRTALAPRARGAS